MTEFIHLVGAEDVQRAASSIRSSAEMMQSAASSMDDSLFRHRQFMDDWLFRLQGLREELEKLATIKV